MTKKSKKNEEEGILEDPKVLARKISGVEKLLEENKVVGLSIVGVLAMLIVGYFGYKYYMENQNALAQDEMFQSVYYFEQDSLDLALNGDGNYYGFLDIVDIYGATKAGNLANFYAGVIYMQKGSYSSAVPFLKDFSSHDYVLQARAYSLLGDSYMQQEKFSVAVDFYEKAISHKPNKFFTPVYLLKAGLAYEKLNDFTHAYNQYEKIITKYGKSAELKKAKKYKARLERKATL